MDINAHFDLHFGTSVASVKLDDTERQFNSF